MTEEQVFALTDPDGPALRCPGRSCSRWARCGPSRASPRSYRTGAGIGWHEHDDDVFIGCETFFRPGYNAHLVAEWIPALDGVEAKLQAGARVADVGCGHGSSTVLMAQAYPASTFIGSDYHDASIETARKRAADAGVADRVTFEIAPAQTFSGPATTS